MVKKFKSNLPDNVLPNNQFFDSNSSVSYPDQWHPLQIETDYMSPKELKRQEKLMARHNRRDTKRSRNKNGSRGEKSNRTDHPSKYAEKTDFREAKSIFIQPRTEKQAEYLAALNDPNTHIVVGSGPAGTGKSYMGNAATQKRNCR